MKNKSLNCLDIKSLYINIPVAKSIKCLENHFWKINITFLLPTFKLIKMCTLYMLHCYFHHNNTFYKEKLGLPMGSPLSGVLACICLEFLESGPFKYMIPCNSNYFRYIDDILLIYPQELDLVKINDRMNKIVNLP